MSSCKGCIQLRCHVLLRLGRVLLCCAGCCAEQAAARQQAADAYAWFRQQGPWAPPALRRLPPVLCASAASWSARPGGRGGSAAAAGWARCSACTRGAASTGDQVEKSKVQCTSTALEKQSSEAC